MSISCRYVNGAANRCRRARPVISAGNEAILEKPTHTHVKEVTELDLTTHEVRFCVFSDFLKSFDMARITEFRLGSLPRLPDGHATYE